MIKIIPAKKPYKPDCGDLVCEWCNEESPKYLVHEEGPGTDKIIPLACAHPNPWIALEMMFGIDPKPIIATYECPYTKYTHYSIVPVALLLNGEVQYNPQRCSADFVMDWEFHKHMMKDRRLDICDIQKLLLGSGFTGGTGHYDGSRGEKKRRVMLDNGDALWCHFWEWYNK